MLTEKKKKKVQKLLEETNDTKKRPKSKFEKRFPEGSKKHDNAFKPPKIVKTGRDTLFSEINGIPFSSEDKVVIPVKDRQKPSSYTKPFTYNRMHHASTFSPPVSSFKANLKREFGSSFRRL